MGVCYTSPNENASGPMTSLQVLFRCHGRAALEQTGAVALFSCVH